MNYSNFIETNKTYSIEEQEHLFYLEKQIRYYSKYYKKGGVKVQNAKNYIIENLSKTLHQYLINPYDFSDFLSGKSINLGEKILKNECSLKRILTNKIHNHRSNELYDYITERKCYKVLVTKQALENITIEINDKTLNKKQNIGKIFTDDEILNYINEGKMLVVSLERNSSFVKYPSNNELNYYDKDAEKDWNKSENLVLDFGNKNVVEFYEKYYPNIFNKYLEIAVFDYNIIYKDMLKHCNEEVRNKYIKHRKQNIEEEQTM